MIDGIQINGVGPDHPPDEIIWDGDVGRVELLAQSRRDVDDWRLAVSTHDRYRSVPVGDDFGDAFARFASTVDDVAGDVEVTA